MQIQKPYTANVSQGLDRAHYLFRMRQNSIPGCLLKIHSAHFKRGGAVGEINTVIPQTQYQHQVHRVLHRKKA